MVSFHREDGKVARHLPKLSRRETQVVRMLLEDKNSKTIAGELGLDVKTIWEFRHRAMQKLGVKTDIGLVREALNNGIVEQKKWLKPYLFNE